MSVIELDRCEAASNAAMRAGSAALLAALTSSRTTFEVGPAPVRAPVLPARSLWPSWYTPPQRRSRPATEIVASVARDFGVLPADLIGAGRERNLVEARAVVARLLKDRGFSTTQTGRYLGGRDHSTIVNLLGNFDIYARRNPLVELSYLARRPGHLV